MQDAFPDGLDELAERRAAAVMAIPTRDVDTWKTVAPPEPAPNGRGEGIGRIALSRARPKPCPECETKEPHYQTTAGVLRCPDCGHEAPKPAEVPA